MLSTRRIGTHGHGAVSRLVHKSSASATTAASSSSSSHQQSYLDPTPPSAVAHQHHQGQQVRTNYSSLIDPGSAAHSKGPGVGGRAQPWQPEENVDIQKVTQTAIVSSLGYSFNLCFIACLLKCLYGIVLHVTSSHSFYTVHVNYLSQIHIHTCAKYI